MYFEQFETNLKTEGKSPRTIRGYLSDLGTFQTWYAQTFGSNDVCNAIQPMDLVDYRAWLQTSQRVSPATLNRHVAALRAFYTWAAENSIAPPGVASRLKTKNVQASTAPQSLQRDEFYRLIGQIKNVKNAAKRYRDMTAVYLMTYAGLRVSEACNVRWDDVDFIGDTIRIRHGKGDKQRVVPLNAKLREILLQWQQSRGEYQTSDSEFVLISTRSAKMDTTAVQKALQTYFDAAKLDDYSCHSLRHTCAKWLVDAGNGIQNVAQILGHESIETTKRYTRPTQKDLQQAIDSI